MVNWIKLDKVDHQLLQLTRGTLHLALQFVAAAPRSYLRISEDDNASWLFWNTRQLRFECNYFGQKLNVQTALDVSGFKLQLLVEEMVFEEIEIYNKSFQNINTWIKNALFKLKLDYNQYQLDLPYDIDQKFPPDGDFVFSFYDESVFKEFSKLYQNAQLVVQKAVDEIISKNMILNVRPRQFDIMTLHQQTAEDGIVIGMSPGDKYYDQPYFYIYPYPSPDNGDLDNTHPIVGKWHTTGFKALVLTYEEIFKETAELEAQLVYDFLKNGISISNKLLSY